MSRSRRARTKGAPPPDRPSFAEKGPQVLVEFPPPEPLVAALVNARNAHLRTYRLGECSAVVTREDGRWHLSVAHPSRYPTWDEVAEARYRLLPEGIVAAMLLPPRSKYVNLHENCFQVFEIEDVHARADA